MEDQISLFIIGLVQKLPFASALLGVLGTLVVVGQIVVALTPSHADDEAWAKIEAAPFVGSLLKALSKFAVIQKK